MITLTKLDRTEQDQIIFKPFVDIYKVTRKLYYELGTAFNHWLNAPEDKVNDITEILRIAHTTSLIIDDIQDNSRFRYGLPAVHHVHGIGLSINAATKALGNAFEKVLLLNDPRALKIYLDAYGDIHRGQGIELYWRDNFQCPTEEEYIDMLKQKSSIMIVVFVQLLQLFSDNTENYQDIAVLIGVYYAMRDDYCNLFQREILNDLADNSIAQHITDENSDNDITDGKFTFAIIHALQRSENAEEIINILKQRTNDFKLINHCIILLKKAGSDKYTADALRRLEVDIENEINRLGGNPKLTTIMKKLRNWRSSNEE